MDQPPCCVRMMPRQKLRFVNRVIAQAAMIAATTEVQT
jgi:hypothetical protein